MALRACRRHFRIRRLSASRVRQVNGPRGSRERPLTLPGHVMQNRAAWRAGTAWLPWRGILCAAAAAVLQTCWAPLDIPRTMRPQTVVLFATPKMLSDFANPEAGVARFLDNYLPLTSRAYQTIVIFAVGNGDHILTYRGMEYWGDTVEWARYTDGVPVSDRTLDYRQLESIATPVISASTGFCMAISSGRVVDGGPGTGRGTLERRRPRYWRSWSTRGVRSVTKNSCGSTRTTTVR